MQFFGRKISFDQPQAETSASQGAFPGDPVLKSRRQALFKIVSSIVERAGEQRHGATLVIDLGPVTHFDSGQKLEVPIDLCDDTMLDLAKSLSKVDGALHIGADLRVARVRVPSGRQGPSGENRARGARFNSALRLSAAHEKLIVVVVSSDRPVSVIPHGIELSAGPDWCPYRRSQVQPPTLEEWVARECETDQQMESAMSV